MPATLGSAGVPPAVFGVPPKTLRRTTDALFSDVCGVSNPSAGRRRERPGRSRFPKPTASFRLGVSLLTSAATRPNAAGAHAIAAFASLRHCVDVFVQMNSVWPGVATGGTGSFMSHEIFFGNVSSCELSAISQVISLPV